MLPNNVTIEEDTCKENTSMLKIHFGKGHSWSMNFQKKEKTYQAESIVFVYSLSDSEYFPNSQSNGNLHSSQRRPVGDTWVVLKVPCFFYVLGTLKATVKPKITDVGLDTNYLCKSKETLAAAWVKQTLWNVHIQAFVSNGTLSAKRKCPQLSTLSTFCVFPGSIGAFFSVHLHRHRVCRRQKRYYHR